jgi:hypothetical protein
MAEHASELVSHDIVGPGDAFEYHLNASLLEKLP